MGRGGNGVWSDLARFRVPPLRGLAARAPYLHDGRAKNIGEVIHFYKDRFDIDFSDGWFSFLGGWFCDFCGVWAPQSLSGRQRRRRRTPVQHTNRRRRVMCAAVSAENNARTFTCKSL